MPVFDIIGEFAALLAQGAVGYIADHSSVRKDGIAFFLIKIVVSVFVYLAVLIGVPLAVIFLVIMFIKFALPLF
jgi:hypothetical protein